MNVSDEIATTFPFVVTISDRAHIIAYDWLHEHLCEDFVRTRYDRVIKGEWTAFPCDDGGWSFYFKDCVAATDFKLRFG